MGFTRFRACLVLSRSGRGYPGLLELISRRCSATSLFSTAENESRHLWRVGPFLRPSPAQDFPSDMGTRGPSVVCRALNHEGFWPLLEWLWDGCSG